MHVDDLGRRLPGGCGLLIALIAGALLMSTALPLFLDCSTGVAKQNAVLHDLKQPELQAAALLEKPGLHQVGTSYFSY